MALLRIGDLARRCGVSRDTLRFYEREGLISLPQRSDAGYRLYGEPDAQRVLFIRRAQGVGLSLDDIRELLRVQRLRTPGACRRVAERLRSRIEIIDQKIGELSAFRFRVSGLLVASQRMKGVVFDTPVAFVGNPGSIFLTFLTSLEALSSRGQKRFAFMDSVEDARIWNDRWFVERKLDREAMIGLVTGNPTPPVKRFHEGLDGCNLGVCTHLAVSTLSLFTLPGRQ